MRERKTKQDLRKKWTEYAAQHLVGRTITSVNYMSDDEAREMDWVESPLIITFDNGMELMPSRDDEGNGAGALFGATPAGEALTFPLLRRW